VDAFCFERPQVSQSAGRDGFGYGTHVNSGTDSKNIMRIWKKSIGIGGNSVSGIVWCLCPGKPSLRKPLKGPCPPFLSSDRLGRPGRRHARRAMTRCTLPLQLAAFGVKPAGGMGRTSEGFP
jgi:hypothetical protein